MAVYTQVGESALNELMADYDLGAALSFVGVTQGIENTNYILTTATGRYVLTLFERRVAEADLPFFVAGMAHLSRGAPAPRPIVGKDGAIFRSVCGRPAILTSFLDGRQHMAPSADDCRRMGELNARLHEAAAGFGVVRKNALGLEAWRILAATCGGDADRCAPGLARLIEEELEFLSRRWPADLPEGLIHADLFPDNVFFQSGRISGVIDFYFACTDFFAYDLALTLNAWAWRDRQWSGKRARALIDAYGSVRRLSAAERAAAPVLLRAAAIRILLTRLHDWLHQVEGADVAVKDPLEYRDLLRLHQGGGVRDAFGPS